MPHRIEEIMNYFRKALGQVPGSIRILGELSPQALEGYYVMRDSVMAKEADGGLDLKTKEILFILLNCVSGNVLGAKEHVPRAMQAGATTRQLLEALIIGILIMGIANWEVAGVDVIKMALDIESEKLQKGAVK